MRSLSLGLDLWKRACYSIAVFNQVEVDRSEEDFHGVALDAYSKKNQKGEFANVLLVVKPSMILFLNEELTVSFQ